MEKNSTAAHFDVRRLHTLKCIVGPISNRTKRVNIIVYLLGRTLISMQNCKSIVVKHYFFNQLLLCNVCRYGLQMMMSVLQEIEGLTKELYFIILSGRKASFHAKFQIHCAHGFHIRMACIIMYCQE